MTREEASSPTARGAADLELDPAIAAALRERLPGVATHTVAAVVVEVPGYQGALTGPMGENIEAAVQMALGGFLKLASGTQDSDPSTPMSATLDGAYSLGRGEARSGRSMDALLAAYRVGARVAWRELSSAAAGAGIPSSTMAKFAELVFAYIDELSAASVAGHADELSTSGRVRERYLERLGRLLLSAATPDVLTAAAERAEWPQPQTLTAVLVPAAQVRGAMSLLEQATLQVGEELPGIEDREMTLLLVPDMHGVDRQHLLRILAGRHAVVGPPRAWHDARASYQRAARLVGRDEHGDEAVDTEQHLPELVLDADPEAIADLRARALEPMAGLRPATAHRLAETLRSWLLHQGRREEVAADLHVHAQTVQYRMGQLRELYGDRLADPQVVLELVLALHDVPVRQGDREAT